ncbi:hypothetical protein [Anaerospora sp.]|uniref:hypothetical protein n=1 Tax=Anaerospora sp. TaxID=1960278 RepID=UPI0028A29701|nr:hypothetical protein [Anaerospora sp.]
MTKVAAIKADSYDPQIVQQAISDVLAHLGGMSQFIQPGDRVLVKPNMLEAVEKGLCVTTDPLIVLLIPFHMLDSIVWSIREYFRHKLVPCTLK